MGIKESEIQQESKRLIDMKKSSLIIVIHHGDPDKFLGTIAELSQGMKISKAQLIRPALELLLRLYMKPGHAKYLSEYAGKYGIDSDVYFMNEQHRHIDHHGGKSMLKISISIDSINYKKALNTIRSKSAAAGKEDKEESILPDIIRIIQPFAGETLGTIPPAAVAELFMLLGHEKAIKLAGEYGVKISELLITAD